MAHALDKGTMKTKTSVELKVVHDSNTGLAVNVFLWHDAENVLHHSCEVANPIAHNGGNIGFLAYNPERDGKQAEARRLELEATL